MSDKNNTPTQEVVYWNLLSGDQSDEYFNHFLAKVETSHYSLFAVTKDNIPKSYDQALAHPDKKWTRAVEKEQTKFESNCTLKWVPYKGQHLNRINWVFNEKDDSAHTAKGRMVLDGSRMLAGRDYDPSQTYCQNVSASSITIAFIIAAAYMLEMNQADAVGSYLIPKPNLEFPKPNLEFPVYVHTPHGYQSRPGMVLEVTGNIYGGKLAGHIFDKDFSSVIDKRGWISCAYDRKFYWKWNDGLPLILITHSDDFCMLLRSQHLYE